MEAASGWVHNDTITGDDRGHVAGVSVPDVVPTPDFLNDVLDQAGIDRIAGLREFLGGTTAGQPILGLETLFGAGATSFRDGNILMGGDGSDMLAGRGGFDILDGDAWLNVRIRIDMGFGVFYTAESMNTDTLVAGAQAGKVYDEAGVEQFGGRTLTSLLLDRTITPDQLSIVREILFDEAPELDVDTATFQGNRAEYEIEGITDTRDAAGNIISSTGTAQDVDGDGFIRVMDLDDGVTPAPGVALSRGLLVDDTDLLRNIERIQFADELLVIEANNTPATGTVTIVDDTQFAIGPDNVVTPLVGQVLTAVANLVDPDGLTNVDPVTGLPAGGTFRWETQRSDVPGWTPVTTGPTFTVTVEEVGLMIRAVAVFQDDAGVPEEVASAGTDNVTEIFSVAENSATDVLPIQADGTSDIPFDLDLDPNSLGNSGFGPRRQSDRDAIPCAGRQRRRAVQDRGWRRRTAAGGRQRWPGRARLRGSGEPGSSFRDRSPDLYRRSGQRWSAGHHASVHRRGDRRQSGGPRDHQRGRRVGRREPNRGD